MPTYLDAVLDITYKPVFNGTPEETKKWLEQNKDDAKVQSCFICLGRTLTFTSIENYLAGS